MKLEYDFLYLGVGKAEHLLTELDTRNNRDFGDAMIRSVFDEVSGAI